MFILILDDVAINNLLMEEAVASIPGADAQAFTSAREALGFARDRTAEIGVVVTDFDMPEMNGLEFVAALRELPGFAHTPIVMVTSNDQRKLRCEALCAGVTDFLSKPFDAPEINARVTNLLALKRAQREQEDRAATLACEVAAAVSVIEAREREIVSRLARAAERRDTDTGEHIARVACYSEMIARQLGCDPAWCDRLALASAMHDVGKIAIHDAILLKPGKLTPEERREMERHAEYGYGILEGSNSDIVQLAAEIALNHHERWDGAGYPRRLAGEDTPLSGRIVAVADVFDALVSDRPYKRAWPLH